MINLLSTSKSWYKRFQYDENVDKPGNVQNIMLLVATLIAFITFQASVTPPGGVWQEDKDENRVGHAIYAYQSTAYYIFLIANTIALSASVLVVTSLTYRVDTDYRDKLDRVRSVFGLWQRKKYGKLKSEMRRLEKKINLIIDSTSRGDSVRTLKETRKRLDFLYPREES
ncbi:hypothetical protein PVK06_043910 [Gossypium arboreum]|uniref:PGG domain-containing protein n=1 Tax=Gossypium arboreum TaxID=29729 RepID=A0ABR0MSA2_GOSAR|nr:hypothetical protein PVK06_043910 [Gossypium arboreum]